MVIGFSDFGLGSQIRKYLCDRYFLECRHTENLKNCVEADIEVKTLLNDGHQHVNADGGPDLRLHSVRRRSVERLDTQMLLRPLEKELHLPAAFVEFSDCQGWEGEIIRQERQSQVVFFIVKLHASELVRVILRGVESGQNDPLIAPQAGRLINWIRIEPSEFEVGLGPDNKVGQALGEDIEPFEVKIPAVHDVERSRFGNEGIEDIDVMDATLGYFDEKRYIPAQIQKGVQLDRGLGFTEPRPREQRKTEVDGG